MSRNYDNWERLVAAVIKRQEIWQLCHQPSRTPSICSEASSSDFSISFRSDFELEKKQESVQKPKKQESVQKPILLMLDPKKRVLKSTQELSKGRIGTSTLTRLRRKVEVLAKGNQLVTKKLMGEAKATEEEFKIVFGDCRQENIVAALLSGYGKFNDFHPPRSLHDLIYGKGSAQRNIVRINQESRLKVAIGAARGIAHLHSQYLAHGNITSSNIFLNYHRYGGGGLTNFYLAGILRMPEGVGGLHYHASEYEFKNASYESDVYSFGVVLLELFTCRSPLKDTHLVEWARSITFDVDWDKDLALMYSYGLILCDKIDTHPEELIGVTSEMFEVARRCVKLLPVDRPKMTEVALMLEEKYKRIYLEESWEENYKRLYLESRTRLVRGNEN